MKQVNLVITGFGRVGRHVASLLCQRQQRYRQLYQCDVRLVAVCGSRMGVYDRKGLRETRLAPLQSGGGWTEVAGASESFTGTSFVEQVEAHVLIEAGPSNYTTGQPGMGYVRTALQRGMHVIAISKGALVIDYPGLAQLARERQVQLKISGATAAALPTIDLLQYNLLGSRIQEMSGIFTGTANFILTRMWEDGLAYADALREAQERGIAEPDPGFDVEGWDTASKLIILANAGFGAQLGLEDVRRSGITAVTPVQIARWRQAGLVPKLIGRIWRSGAQVEAETVLQVYPLTHPFAQVKGSAKGVLVQTEEMGELFVSGGKSDPRAAAAAALKDLEHILQNEKARP